MRSYEEMADNILNKYNARLEQKKRRKAIIIRTAVSVSGIGVAAATALFFWNSNAVKQSIHTDMRSDIIVSETETEPAVSTTQTTAKQNETVHTTASSESKTVTSTAKATSAPVTVSSTATRSQQTSHKVSETSVSVQTGSSAPEAQTTETTAVITPPADHDIAYEGSFYMKKLPAYLTALVTAVTASPIIPNAADGELPIPAFTPPTIFQEGTLTRKSVEAIANGEFDLDLNSDGHFDIFDCYALYRSVWNAGASAEMREKCRQNADYNHDGIVDPLDCKMLVYYYGLFCDVKPEIYYADYYAENCPDTYGPIDELLKILEKYRDEQLLMYNTTVEEYDKEDITLVFNYKEMRNDLDGLKVGEAEPDYEPMIAYFTYNLPEYGCVEDYSDWNVIFTDYIFEELETMRGNYKMIRDSIYNGTVDIDVDSDGEIDYDDIVYLTIHINNTNGSFTFPEGVSRIPVDHPDEMLNLPEDIEKKCEKAVQGFEGLVGNREYSTMIDRCDFRFFEYLCSAYFEKHPVLDEYTDHSYYQKTYGLNAGFYSLEYNVQHYLEYTNVSKNENVFNQSLFNTYFADFITAVENGEKEIPDINFDGKYDKWDPVDAHLYFGELFGGITVESGRTLSDELINKIKSEFDLNGDGICGDIYDTMIAECYYLYIGVPADDEAEKAEFMEHKLDTYYSVLEKTDVERSGDANDDQEVTMADAVMIMQSYANPDKYKMTAIGKFKGDICNTGDGITPKDAQAIQKKLLGL